MNESIEKSISTKELLTQYDWYQKTFSELVQSVSDDFFANNFIIKFIGLSKNINCLSGDEANFVTRIRIEKDYDVFFRLNEKAVEIILTKILGKSSRHFDINTVTGIETKIITSFNAYLYDALKNKINSPNPKELDRNNFDMINLTFIIKDISPESNVAGRIILTLPQVLLSPESIKTSGEKFSKEDFSASETYVKIKVGKTSFTLYDIKNLEVGDLVVFDNSDIRKLKLLIFDNEMDVNLSPNMNIAVSEEINQEGDNMPQNNSLWDSIEVDMYAEFDSVKITLGDLKNIESGSVVDLTSLYENKVTLRVEGKDIATGSLVIVNDRYGVKIDNVIATQSTHSENSEENETSNPDENESVENEEFSQDEEEYSNNEGEYNEEEYSPEEQEENSSEDEEDFDYSDFELEDEGI